MQSSSDDPVLRDVPEIDGQRVFDNRYSIEGTLGSGSFGTVYLARHLYLDDQVAIKVLAPHVAHTWPEAVQRFRREATAAKRVSSDYVVQVRDICTAHGLHFIVMEYVDGIDLQQLVTRDGPLPIDEVMRIAVDMTRGLADAHRVGLIHRDIKPSNLLIGRDGSVKIADLGLAKDQALDVTLTDSGKGMGSPLYMPPEQFLDAKIVGATADVYSLGATMYFLATQQHGYSAKSYIEALDDARNTPFPDPRLKRPDTPARLADLIARCTAKDANARPVDAEQVLRALESIVEPDGEPEPGLAAQPPSTRGSERERVALSVTNSGAAATIELPANGSRSRSSLVRAFAWMLGLAVAAPFGWFSAKYLQDQSLDPIDEVHASLNSPLRDRACTLFIELQTADRSRGVEIAEEIGRLREEFDTEEMACMHATAMRVSVDPTDVDQVRQLVENVAAIRSTHDTPGMAWEHATALAAASMKGTIEEVRGFADEIGRIRAEFDSDELAGLHAQALYFIPDDPRTPLAREIAFEIGAIRELHNTEEVAKYHARTLVQCLATVGLGEEFSTLFRPIETAWQEFQSVEAGRQYAMAMWLLVVSGSDTAARHCETQVATLQSLLDDDDVALSHARIVFNLANRTEDMAERMDWARAIGDIRKEFNTRDIALEHARTLVSAHARPVSRETSDEIMQEFRKLQLGFDDSELAYHHARAIYNVLLHSESALEPELIDRMAALHEAYDSPGVALEHAKALTLLVQDPEEAASAKNLVRFARAVDGAWRANGFRGHVRALLDDRLPSRYQEVVGKVVAGQ